MSAPLTPPPPPHEQSAQSAQSARGAWQSPSSDGPAAAFRRAGKSGHAGGTRRGWWYEEDGTDPRTELREGAVTAAAVALGGVLLGVLWWWLAPRVPLVGAVVGDNWAVYAKDSEGEQAIAVDGTFTLLALGLGMVSALAVFLLRRRGGVPLVVGLAAGGLLGSVLAWRLGVWLGPTQDVIAHARSVGKGVTFDAPLKLGAKGALLAWPFAALVAHLGLTSLFGPRDPDPLLPPEPSVPQG
ncbi:AAA family ATPase [Streptomyces sp. CHD11]|uniref:AAA family ATPase n=1 Tax=Streptomyces sp. CHD11 TaxID=2741325 RepID=UPI001BFCA536|nr:AAA family ATPase [Streptomyces sp. CHD11]MBT3149687.1 AAA family ATPase [Streptomyces sp. CHD11]